MNNQWKDIPGYEGYYQASKTGYVRSVDRVVPHHKGIQLKRGRILKHSLDRVGYPQIALSINNVGKSYKVHQLIARTWIENPENKPQVNHKNGIKIDNRIENLEWVTVSENIRHSYDNGFHKGMLGEKHHQSKISDKKVIELRNEYNNAKPLKYYAKKYGITISATHRIVRGITYKHLL